MIRGAGGVNADQRVGDESGIEAGKTENVFEQASFGRAKLLLLKLRGIQMIAYRSPWRGVLI